MARYQLISADSHVVESPDLWKKWLAPEYHARAPQLLKDAMGGDAWQYRSGTAPVPLGLVTTYPGRTYEDFRWEGAKYDKINQGAFHGPTRLKEQDEDGVDAEVLYPSQRTMMHFMLDDDRDFHRAGIEAYNNWMAKEFMSADPSRLIGLAQIPNLGVEEAVKEMRRAKQLGMRGVICSSWPAGATSISKEDDAFWEEAVKLNMPISIHLKTVAKGGGAQTGATGKFDATGLLTSGQKTVAGYSTAGMDSMPPIVAETIVSGLFDRYPELIFISVEAGAGWVPYLLEQMDDRYWRNRHWAKVQLEMLPSEYFRRNWRLTFVQDFYGVRNRHDVGIDNMMWSTDYPHHISDWPYSRKIANEMFVGVPEDERHRICAGNAAKLYGLPS
ncbi:MAG TPA: amidohydrolase family protein [Candidatus Bathyarchaeia archaeon]|nr:amidohydrolase family protein [Candidatus Bathyarchaeia archaeon]